MRRLSSPWRARCPLTPYRRPATPGRGPAGSGYRPAKRPAAGPIAGCALILTALLPAAATAAAAAGDGGSRDYRVQVPRLADRPVIDGRLEDAVWAQAALLDGFRQFEPEVGAPATEPTEVRIGYDGGHLYFGIRCHDSEPEKIVANARLRDAFLGNDDAVEIVLDTFHDRRNGFLFAVSPLAAQVDALVRDEGDEVNYSWDGIWDAAASRDGGGWSAELAIPFKTLRFPIAPEQTWGLNVRSIVRKRENLLWKPMARSSGNPTQYQVSQYGEITGLRDLEPGKHLTLVPYVLGGGRRATGRDGEETVDGGLDLKWAITSSLIADFTYNTDFAEAEADHQQVNLTRFKLFFPEKRGFFLEGADLFYFGERADFLKSSDKIFFFSRRIGLSDDGTATIPVLGGAKLSGHAGKLGLGLLSLITEETTYTDGAGRRLREPRTSHTVLRLTREVLDKSSVGLIGLGRDVAVGDDHSGFGADWSFAFGDHLQTGGFLAGTSTAGAGGDGWAGQADLLWDGDLFFSHLTYTAIDDEFDPQMGFFTRLGVEEWRSVVSVQPRPKIGNLRQLYVFNELTYVTDTDGEVETRTSRYEVDAIFHNGVYLAFKLFDNWEVLDQPFEIHPGVVIPPGSYKFTNWFVGWQTVPSKRWFLFGRALGGEFWDGSFRTAVLGARLRPVGGFFSRLFWEHNDVELPAGDFTTDLITAQIDYAFTPRLSTKSLLQWSREDNFSGQAILRWTFRPGSDLYLVYDERRDLTVGAPRLEDRSFIAKLSYRVDF